MTLHRLAHIVLGVPNPEAVGAYYEDFGLQRGGVDDPITLSTVSGGVQLTLVRSHRRRLLRMDLECDDPDDLNRIEQSLTRLGESPIRHDDLLESTDTGTATTISVQVAPRLASFAVDRPQANGPGRPERTNERAAAVTREGPVHPRKLGHVVVGSTDQERSQQILVEGFGFKVSDQVKGRAAFLRCSSDHHNVLVQRAPIPFLHHTAWEVDDIDEIGRGAMAMLEADPARHVWGLGRHHIGSNFFWYLRDPAGNFSEYYSDLDCVTDDDLWTPQTWEGPRGMYNWGPKPPPSFLAPEDLAELMTNAHESR